MSLLMTYIVLQGVLLYTLNKVQLSEHQLIDRWRQGDLSYMDILVLHHHKHYILRKLDRTITIGSHPGLSKKND